MSLVQNYLTDLVKYQYDPTRIQRGVLGLLENRVDIVDPTNPFVFLLEASSVSTAGFMEKDEVLTRRQYPTVAQTQEELYLHMSDRDYIGRFALPATTQFSLIFPVDELRNRLVDDPATKSRKLVIPRNTFFTVGDTVFSLQYPIVIFEQTYGGLQVQYDTDQPSPLQTLSSNVVPKVIRRVGDTEYLTITFDVQQFKILSKLDAVSLSKEYTTDITFEDQYYYTRVYRSNADGTWTEIRTTHTDQVYNPKEATAVLRVTDNKLTVTIPQVYIASGLVSGRIRIDVYQTKGPIDLNLAEFASNSFGATWEAYDKNDRTVFVAPLSNFQQIIPISDRFVSGGRAALDFETLRRRVISRSFSSDKVLPITNVSLETALEDGGFDVVKNVDNITNRVFLATRSMPQPTNKKLITAAAASMETINLKADEAVQINTVIDNGSSITLKPDTIYQNINGVTKLVSNAQLQQLLNMSADQRAVAVTGNGYSYSPFHYVLDMSGSEFDLRAYYLDSPEALAKSAILENDTTQLQVATNGYGIFKTDSGFVLQITTTSSASFKALTEDLVHVQLAYTPAYERDRAYLNGVYAGRTEDGEFIFNFDLSTRYNVDKGDNLELMKFLLYTTEERITGAPLETTFDVLYSVSSVMDSPWRPNAIDQILGNFLLPLRVAGVTWETLQIRFGYALDTLWSRGRTVVAATPFQTYQVDVPMLYREDIYQVDPITGNKVIIQPDGTPKFVILHHKNDPVIGSDGLPIYQYRKGDTVLDAFGNPVPVGPRGLIRQIDLMLIEGVYWFATDSAAQKYREEIVNNLILWLTVDLPGYGGSLLEQSALYYYPKATQGYVRVVTDSGIVKTIDAGQSFTITCNVTEDVYRDEDLKERLTLSSIQVLNTILEQKNISYSSIIAALCLNYGNDVISFKVDGLGGNNKISSLTVVDDVNRCSLRKRLEALADGSLIVSEDVTLVFVTPKKATSA